MGLRILDLELLNKLTTFICVATFSVGGRPPLPLQVLSVMKPCFPALGETLNPSRVKQSPP